MKYQVIESSRATCEIYEIFDWLCDRSPQGAEAWLDSWEQTVQVLRESAGSYGLAPENVDHDVEVRQVLFKPRRGKRYRALYMIDGNKVIVLHVRGHGQDRPTQ